MEGKICIVTGANAGIGLVTTRELARAGAEIAMVCRSRERGEAARAEIVDGTGNPRVTLYLADLASQAQVHRVAQELSAAYERIDVLVNNAGIALPSRTLTDEGVETVFAVNHVAYFVLTNLLLPRILGSAPARIVSVASRAPRRGRVQFDNLQGERRYSQLGHYSNTKLYNILFTRALAGRLAGTGVTANCLHPGVVGTEFGQDVPSALAVLMRIGRPLLLSPARGAETSLHLATAPEVADVNGAYFAKCRCATPSRRARNDAVGERLWRTTTDLTGVDFPST